MSRTNKMVLPSTALLICLALQPIPAVGVVACGALVKDYAYVPALNKDDPFSRLNVVLLHAGLNQGELHKTILCGSSQEKVTRWRIQQEKLWLITRGRTPFFTDQFIRVDLPELLKGRLQWGPMSKGEPYSFVAGWGPVPNNGSLSATFLEFPLFAQYDYLPISPESVRLFLLSNSNARFDPEDHQAKQVKLVGDFEKRSLEFSDHEI